MHRVTDGDAPLADMPTGDNAEAAELVRAWLDDPRPDGVDSFWSAVSQVGTPLVRATADRRRSVTFLWRANRPLAAVYLLLNRVTDKQNFERGLMQQVGSTDVWKLTLNLDPTLRASYAFSPVPDGPSVAKQLDSLRGRQPQLPFFEDPLQHGAGTESRIRRQSILALDQAPRQPEWETLHDHRSWTVPAGSARRELSEFSVAGRRRPLWTYLPAAEHRGPLAQLILLDAETWFTQLGLQHALDRAIVAGRIAPTAVVGLENLDVPDRLQTLGANPALIDDLRTKIIPWLQASHPEQTWRGRESRYLCGQSLGGLTALAAAIGAPETFGTVLAHSPSMWWRPDGSTTPADLMTITRSWITEEFAATSPQDVRIRCDVGTLEKGTVEHLETLTGQLSKRGWNAELVTYTGGHDFAWWRGALIDGLAAIDGTRQHGNTDVDK